jgi:hypothetical protein
MKRDRRGTTGFLSIRGYSFQATWRALSGLAGAHFPLILPGAHPLVSFFILRRLKRLGYSDCRVISSDKGLVVHAHR